MYSPYGSYSSMSSPAQPMEIPTNSYLFSSRDYSASCAFPSWPQRSSLTNEEQEQPYQRASSYLSDDDLFPCDGFEDDAHSVSSAGSTTPTSPTAVAEDAAEMLRIQREQQMAVQREAVKFLLNEKERRRQQLKRQRRGSGGSSKKSTPKSKQAHLDAIAEAGE
ncbi:uncharacterized protein F4822DRAFT_262704 [Hypoxylon trugodes]|uniref:uncharacterized protein n=1 Tax=Hypoxylon trugodes TaxID=326681 RepID=UPI0021928656|nr:uncharacterized protein F4822DRAFT_262704 [Hypoxylon trugodes]KAI1388940.1 hypothetical protein F4822DRAFT_262704 [Hypoxylon trugodes]